MLNEVSSLRLGAIPAFQGSCITTILEHPKKPAAVSTSDRAAVGGPVMTGRIRRTFETPITVR